MYCVGVVSRSSSVCSMRWLSSAGKVSGNSIWLAATALNGLLTRMFWPMPVNRTPVREVVLMVFAETVSDETKPSELLRSKVTASWLPMRS